MGDEETTIVEETTETTTPVVATPPADPAVEAAHLREENARLRGENTALRETRLEPTPPATPKPPPTDPHVKEFQDIESDFAKGVISDAERTVRLGALGAKTTLDRHADEQRQAQARARDETARGKSSQKIAVYLQRVPGLSNASGPEMQRVLPHLRDITEEFGLEPADPRAQALALERTFGPINRSSNVDTREFERRRLVSGGGGGTFGEEPPPPVQAKSQGERIWNQLLPEFQQFYISTRGSKEAAIKTLDHADEHQMRKQGRFR